MNFLLKFKGVSGIIVGFKGTILLGEHLKKTQNFRHNMSKLGQPDVISTLIWTKISHHQKERSKFYILKSSTPHIILEHSLISYLNGLTLKHLNI